MVFIWILFVCVSSEVRSDGSVDVCQHIQSCCLDDDKLCPTDITSDVCKVNCSKYHDCSSSNHVRLSRLGTACQTHCTSDTEACHVECITGYYGNKCHFGCGDKCLLRKCHRDNGSCELGCKAGSFGQKCGSTCNRNCKGRRCHRETGSCLHGCSPGYYGTDCLNKCQTACRYRVCDRENGHCSLGCTERLHGPLCQRPCPDGCSLCHPETGECIFEHIPVNEGMSCTKKILAVFWGSVGAFLLLAGAAMWVYRSHPCFTFKKKKKGLDTLFIDDREPMDLPNIHKQDTRSSHYEEILCSGTDSHFQHISKSTGSINLRTLIGTVKYPKQCNTPKRKRTRADAGRNATSLGSSVRELNNMHSFWLGSEREVDEMSEHPDKKEEPLEKCQQGSKKDVVRFSGALDEDEAEGLDASLRGTEGERKSLSDDMASEDPGKRAYISAIFNGKDDATIVHAPCEGIHPGMKKTD